LNTALPANVARRSLVRRLTRLNLTVLFVSMVASFLLIALVLWLTARERQGEAAELAAIQTANNVAAMLLFQDKTEAGAELALLVSHRELAAIALYDAKGQLFARTALAVPPLATQFIAEQPLSLQREHQGLQVYLQVPVVERDELVGVLVVVEKQHRLMSWFIQGVFIMSAIMALLYLLCARVLVRIQQSALQPLIELSALAERVATERNFSLRADISSSDELGSLGRRFNELLKRIEIWQGGINTELAQAQQTSEQLTQLALHDSLTGLPNRLYFSQLLSSMVAHSRQHQQHLALLFIDLDNFKYVNDHFGHEAGDALLVLVGQRLSAVLRCEDKLCRLGGDEFALLLPAQSSLAATRQVCQRLLAQIREPLLINEVAMPVGISVGVALCPEHSDEPATLLQLADEAMYVAKRAGKNDFYIWQAS